MAYCMYTAASVLIYDVKAGDLVATQALETLMRALRCGVATCPIVHRSLDIITSSLKLELPSRLNTPSTSGTQMHTGIGNGLMATSLQEIQSSEPRGGVHNMPTALANYGNMGQPNGATTLPDINPMTWNTTFPINNDLSTRGYLPAFPFTDVPVDLNGLAPSAGQWDGDAFSLLDCFPENRFEGIEGNWYQPT